MSTKAQSKTEQSNQKFAVGMSFKKLFFIFLIGSIFGAIYEDILVFCKTWLETGQGVWMLHRGVIYGPFNVVYGFGAVIMIFLFARDKFKKWEVFLLSALLGGVFEYVISFLQELFTGTRSWDYSGQLLNLNGRTTIPFMLFWGLLGLVVVKYVYPFLSKWIERIPPHIGNTVFIVLLIFMILNIAISWTAVIRQSLRQHNVAPFTPIGEFYDYYYTDQFLQKYYPNMVRIK